jgi:hypothetical protein
MAGFLHMQSNYENIKIYIYICDAVELHDKVFMNNYMIKLQYQQ